MTSALIDCPWDDLDTLDPGAGPAPLVQANAQRLLSILHTGAKEYFIQNITIKTTIWFKVGEPLIVPDAWLKTGSLFFGVHGSTVRVTDKDRQKPKNVGKADRAIERFVTSKNETIEAVNSLYAEFDGKDFTAPTQAEISDQFARLRADPEKATSPDKSLWNEALGAAKLAKYLTNPEHYKALAIAHVAQLSPAPSVTVASGGGWQCYWLLAETFYLRTNEDRLRARATQARWVALMGGDTGAKDLARKLRLPGSYNYKKAYAPNFPLVSFTKADFDLRYSLDSLEACLPVPVAPEASTTHTKAHSGTTEATGTATLDIAQLQAKNDSLVSLFNASFKQRDFLRLYGFSDTGDRMSRPGEPESKGVEIDEATNRSRHWSGNDPLYDPHWQTPFSVWCRMEFDNDFAAARQHLIDGIFPNLRLWGRTTSFGEHIPDAFKTLRQDGKLVYMADSTDTKVFDAMLDVYEKVGGFGASVSKRIGGRNAGVGANTFVRSLQRMSAFFDVTVNDDHTYYVRLKWENVVLSRWTTYALLKMLGAILGGPSDANDFSTPIVNEYSPRKADEPFLIGTSKLMRDRFKLIAQTLDITVKQAKDQDEFTFASFGESGLRVLDAMIRAGDMTAQELADETGKKVSSIRAAVRKLVQHGIVEAEREGAHGPKVYSLAPDVWQRIDELTPSLRTYTTAARREDKRLEAAQQWAQKGIAEAQQGQNTEQAQRLERRFAKLAHERLPHLARLHPDLAPKDIERLAYEVAAYRQSPEAAKQVRDYRTQETAEHRDEVRLIRELVADITNNFVADGLRKPTTRMVVDAIMQFGTFDEGMVRNVIGAALQVTAPVLDPFVDRSGAYA